MESKPTTKVEAESKAREIVGKWVTGAALTGWLPGSSFVLGAGDMLMIRQVGEVFGVPALSDEAITAHFGGLFASILGGTIATELVGLVPVLGWVAKSAVLAGKAQLIGDGVITKFKEISPLP